MKNNKNKPFFAHWHKVLLHTICFLCILVGLVGCGNNSEQSEEPTSIMIEAGITNSLKEDAGIKFDRMSDFSFSNVDLNEDDMSVLKSKYASKIPFIKYETTFSLVSVEMDMIGNYSGIFVYNNGEWQFSFGYITNEETWEYQEKEASRVDKQRMLDDLKEQNFGTFEKGYVGDVKYSSIGSITNREYNESIHQDIINTDVKVKTDFAEYSIPATFTYYFQKGEWILGGVEVSDIGLWELEYSDGNEPEFLSDSTLLSYLTTSSNFLTYICNLDYVQDYKITKESEIASKESVTVNYIFSVTYQYIGTVNYNVELVYEWLSNEWSEPQPTPSVNSSDFTEMLGRTWKNDDGSYFVFKSIESSENENVKMSGQYITGVAGDTIDIVANLSIMLRDNNWDANITDINGNQIWDIPASSFTLNLEYGAMVYDDKYYAPVEINIIDSDEPENTQTISSNVLIYAQEDASYENQIIRDNLMLNKISVSYKDEIFTFSGNITNQAEGQSSYEIRIAMFDENDYIIAEGITSSGDALLLPESAAIVKITINDIDEEDISKIKKIIVYVKA